MPIEPEKTGHFKVFDAQVVYGKSYIGPNSDLKTYLASAPDTYEKSLLIPTATHDFIYDDGLREISCVWEDSAGKPSFYKIMYTEEKSVKIYSPVNPYERFNKFVGNLVHDINEKQKKRKLYFALKFHPHLDTKESLEKSLSNTFSKAIKINGLSSYSSPEDIPTWAVNVAKNCKIPFFAHTDFYSGTPESGLQRLMNKNHPRKWFEWALANKVSIFLAHGCRLDYGLLREISGRKDVLVGIGPASLMQDEQDRLINRTGDYISDLLNSTDRNNLAFCTDYRWNVEKRNDWDSLDWDSHKSVINALQADNVSDNDIEKILYLNSERFFNAA